MSHLLKALLAELSDGLAHPCDRLARRLGISTTQVDSAIHTLKEWGLECEREAGGLCRLSVVPDLFDRSTIEEALPQALRQDLGLVLLLSTDSTNDHIWQQKDRSETWQLCLAEHQSRGRGRRGRVWHNPFAGVLCFSLLWRPRKPQINLEGLSLAAGLALLQTLEAQGLDELSLKWPNDVLAQGKKLAGILIETRIGRDRQPDVVIGIGVNMRLPEKSIRGLDQPAIDLHSLARTPVSKNATAAQLVVRLTAMLEQFQHHGFAAFREQWCCHDALAGRILHLDEKAGAGMTGLGQGVDEDGSLIVQTDQGVRRLRAGDVKLQGVEKREHS